MSDDPSQVDSGTLIESLIRDVEKGQAHALEAYHWFTHARVAAYELKRRRQHYGPAEL